jgi:hypothetical protein
MRGKQSSRIASYDITSCVVSDGDVLGDRATGGARIFEREMFGESRASHESMCRRRVWFVRVGGLTQGRTKASFAKEGCS